jgi:hypothetical protein
MRDDDRDARHQQTTNGYTVVTFAMKMLSARSVPCRSYLTRLNADRSGLIFVVWYRKSNDDSERFLYQMRGDAKL